jgi:diguanylate cyclase (GGDEF)-like protein
MRGKSFAAIPALVMFVSGMLPTVIAAKTLAQRDADQAHKTFIADAGDVASTLKLGIHQAEGLVINSGAYVASKPRTTPAAFARWGGSARVLQRYPELRALGVIELVPARELGAFRARMLANPILPASRQPTASRRQFQVLPQGRRPYYCLAAAGVVRSPVTQLPPGLDYCAIGPTLLRSRDSGKTTYVPFKEGSVTTMAVQTPVYRGAPAPSTLPARHKAFMGWLGATLSPEELLTQALQSRRHIAVTFRYRARGSDVTFSSGAAPAGAQTTTVNLRNGWTVGFAAPGARGIFSDRSALTSLGAGTALSLLAVVLMFVIKTAQTRAQSLVRERTSELAYQAQHDTLTGLPNRALMLDQAERLLAQGRLAAAMFIDLDGFKQVNDGFGHAAGDALLKAVGGRLRGAVREQDIVARLGGDEFVVLLDAAAGDTKPQALAQRIVRSVREPIRMPHGMILSVSASVGLSTLARASVSDFLNDADVAVYAAKEAGKGCYKLFEPGMESATGAGVKARRGRAPTRQDESDRVA